MHLMALHEKILPEDVPETVVGPLLASPLSVEYEIPSAHPEVQSTRGAVDGCVEILEINIASTEINQRDYYDAPHSVRGYRDGMAASIGLSSSAAVTEFVLLAHDVAPKASTIGAIGSVFVAALTTIYGTISMSERYQQKKAQQAAPVISGYALENLRVGGTSDRLAEGSIALVVLSQQSAEAPANIDDVLEVARRVKADAVIAPVTAIAGNVLADVKTSEPLVDILAEIKQGLTVPNGSEHLPYIVIGKEAFETIEADDLQRVLDLVAVRFPQMIPHATVPQTSHAAHELARQLRPLAILGVEAHLENERQLSRDIEGVPLRTRRSRFVLPGSDDDPFNPSVWLQYSNNGDGAPAERRAVASFVPANFDMATVLAGMTIQTAQVLPVITETLQKLKVLDESLRMASQLLDEVEQKQLIFMNRSFGLATPRAENLYWKKSFREIVGVTAVAATVFGGLTALAAHLAQQEYEQGFEHTTAAIGSAASVSQPTWRLEEHGIDAAGYYPELKYYALNNNFTWTNVESESVPLSFPTDIEPVQPHITAAGYFSSDTADRLVLPIKEDTELGALQITEANGKTVPFKAYESEDGTTGVLFEEPPQHTVKIEYDLVDSDDDPGATRTAIIIGLDKYNAQDTDTTNSLLGVAENYAETFEYDNTELLDTLVQGADSPEEFYARSVQTRIANCATMATTLAIDQVHFDSNDKLAYTTGYRASGRYLRQPHAWLTNGNGMVIDGTPGVRGRSAAEAGLTLIDEATEDKAWQQRSAQFEADKLPRLPFEHVPTGMLGALAAGLALQRLRYSAQNFQRRLAARHLTEGQAHHIISHAAFGDSDEPPLLGSQQAPLSLDSIPFEATILVAANPGKAGPYLTRAQRRGLRRHAKLILGRHTEQ